MMMNQSGATLSATAAPMSTLLNLLQGQAGRPIIDKTDLKGLFDFSLQFAPAAGGQLTGLFGTGGPPAGPSVTPPTAADPAPSFFTAIQEQLGLKLEATKGPVEVLVIDSVQKPMEN